MCMCLRLLSIRLATSYKNHLNYSVFGTDGIYLFVDEYGIKCSVGITIPWNS